MLRLIVVLTSLSCALNLSAQNVSLEVINQVKQLFTQINPDQNKNNTDHVYYLNYSVQTVARDSLVTAPADMNLKVWMNKSGLYLKCETFELVQDKEDSYMIMPQRRTIFCSDGSLKKNNVSVINTGALRDSLLDHAELTRIEELENGYRKAIFEIADKRFKIDHISGLEVVYHPGKNWLESVLLTYDTVHPLLSASLTFHEIEKDYQKDSPIPTSASEFIWASKNQVNPRFEGYRLINNKLK
ncbi:hypothetical protein KFE98_14415 [bacterium SCSIO 12741]|nr:hypothetical protein KFE98_14415 [bacterium SCSIO 12741]